MPSFHNFYVLILIHLVVKAVNTVDRCTQLIESNRLKDNYCDGYLIASLTKELKQIRSTNKYLKEKFQKYKEDIANTCGSTSAIKRCAKPEVFLNCKAAIKNGAGPYVVSSPLPTGKPLMVYCELSSLDDYPWIVIQRRVNNEVDFEENWENYVNGFGDINNSFWIGLQKLHNITYSKSYELRISLKDWDDRLRYAFYDHFAISGAETGFSLMVLGKYTGDAGDSLREHIGFAFSTFDNAQDSECAKKFKGAWWFGKLCRGCHLNGELDKVAASKGFEGIIWSDLKGGHYRMNYCEMAIREKFYKKCN